MSNEIRFDRKKGFVALPIEVLEIDLSPGAFRTLVELCRMANVDGYCWPSLGQLSDRLGRSRSAISGYLKDLRAEGLIETEEQRTANGYNYRLKYRVTFWADWRAAVSQKLPAETSPKPERSVRSSERPKGNKNQIHKNQTLPPAADGLDDLILEWSKVFKGAPYPTANHSPSSLLLNATRTSLSTRCEIISSDIIRQELFSLWRSLNLKDPENALNTYVKHIQYRRYTDIEFRAVLNYIRGYILPHWRKVPGEKQFLAMLKSSGIRSLHSKRTVLEGFQKRWELAEKALCQRAA